MAESTDTEDTAVEAVNAKLGLTQILAIIGLVIVTQIAMKFVLDIFFPAEPVVADEALEDAVEEEIPVDELGPANYLPLDPALVVNIQSREGTQFLQTNIQLMTRDPDVYEAAKLHAPALRSALILLFSTVQFDSLATLDGKVKLQEDARAELDRTLLELAGVEGVDAVFLTSMVFQ